MKPASTIIKALGGEAKVAKIAGLRSATTPYRWKYARDKGGTGGVIPGKYLSKLLDYALRNNIPLEVESFLAPEVTEYLSAPKDLHAP